MSHLTLETMARLVDEAPTTAESEHLASCAACRAELEGMREDVHALSLLPDVEPAPDAWAGLEQRLGDEGLIRQRRTVGWFGGTGVQGLSWAAAALVVFMAGTMAGRLTTGTPQQVAQLPAAPDRGGSTAVTDPVADPQGEPAAAAPRTALARSDQPDSGNAVGSPTLPERQPRRGPPVTFAASGTAPAVPRNMAEAADLLRQTEELYLAALTRYAELATQSEAGDPVARLAALQSIVMTTQAALSQAPADPVINGYHLTAVAQRDATLRHVAAATSDRWY